MRYLFLPDGKRLYDLVDIPTSETFLVVSALPTLNNKAETQQEETSNRLDIQKIKSINAEKQESTPPEILIDIVDGSL